jgi:cystathionine gamma-synthase
VGQSVENPLGCLLFASRETAEECKAYATRDPRRGDELLEEELLSIRVFDVKYRYYAVIVPAPKMGTIVPFWINPGMGVSSRRAEESLKYIDELREVTDDTPQPQVADSPAQTQLRERIAGLLERAPVGPVRSRKVQPEDVYLFPTGMGAIYSIHRYLLKQQNKPSVLFGFAFHSTIHVLEDYGPGCKSFGNGDAKDLDDLETYLEAEAKEGRSVQALYTEFPANPLLRSPDLIRLRQLADKYHFVLAVDDTIGSFCNVDVLGVADVTITSLTKSFSGYADVIAGSVVLNPSSAIYSSLKSLFNECYTNYFFNRDAETLEINSRDYLSRSKTMNNNALRVAEYLQTRVLDPKSSVTAVHYPPFLPSLPNYQKYMRPATEEFTPGYGCLLSIDFESVPTTAAFIDNLNVHQGPHLGAHLTLAMTYVMTLYGAEHLDWVATFGLKESQIRISVGLEDTEALLGDFKVAIEAADKVKASG